MNASPRLFQDFALGFAWLWKPRRLPRLWPLASLRQAITIGLLHSLLSLVWIVLIDGFQAWWQRCDLFWRNPTLMTRRSAALPVLWDVIALNCHKHLAVLADYSGFEWFQLLLSILIFILAFWVVLGLLFLPWAAQAGSNHSVLQRVLRAVGLSQPLLHLWGLAYLGLTWGLCRLHLFFPTVDHNNPANLSVVSFYFLTGSLLAILSLWLVVPGLLPPPSDLSAAELPVDPRCDQCGYNLRASQTRCPECGHSVEESLQGREPLAWEKDPHWRNFPGIWALFCNLLCHPMALLRHMPLRSGQQAAQRWLVISLAAIWLGAFWILPLVVLMPGEFGLRWSDWHLWVLSAFVATLWMFMALEMIGIETLGIHLAGRFRKERMALTGISKLTIYCSILMLFWVFLGGIHLWWIKWAIDHNWHRHLTPYTWQGIFALSVVIAHIGGLAWFELTVYRGRNQVVYANR